MKWLMNLLRNNESGTPTPYNSAEYKGLSDFLLHAPQEKKIEVFTEAAKRANEDQRRTLERAGVPF